jgi:class 3 adenylate cyclase/tetratricopeptide (TPR) repeat protein
MSAPDVAQWLRSLGLGHYEQAFREADIDGEVLADLDDADLEKLGVSLGHRKKLLKAIAALAGPGETAPAEPGAPAAIEGERRQVTVLFADLADYTRLTHELGAEAMHEITDRFFGLTDGIIERFGGTIDKHIGDCAMAVFGAPVAHGNDPERAVRAALAIRDAMPELSRQIGRELQMHVGIASGQIVASGGMGHKTYSITGDSVNLASRLTGEALPGMILISDAVRRLLADRIACTEFGALPVKGFAAPVIAWALRGVGQPAEPGERLFVGRRAELRQFEGVLASCRETGIGQTVYVRGEAGIGKTRLVSEFQRKAAELGLARHVGLVLDFGTATGQDAVGALVRSLLGLSSDSDGTTAEAAAAGALASGLLVAERRVFLNDFLDLPQPTALRALYDAMDHATRNRGKRETLAELVCRSSERRALLLVIEDIHWADQLILEQIAHLADSIRQCPVVLAMTSRVEGDPLDGAWRARMSGSSLITIDLGPLRPQEAAALAEAYVDASGDLARRCIDRAAGNPLFLEQLLRHAEQSVETGVPDSVRSLVQARIDQLEPSDKLALQAASIFGQRFGLDALRYLIDRSNYDCGHLQARFLIRPQGNDFLFAHALIRDGVYESLLGPRRRALHSRAAEWFAERDLALRAQHLDTAGNAEAPRAYLAAAQQQAKEYRYERARGSVERGLELAAETADIHALTRFYGRILHDLGAMPESLAAYQAALEAAGNAHERCAAWLGLAAVKRITDDLDGAFADLALAEAAAIDSNLVAERARIHFLRGNLCFPRGDIHGCLSEHRKSLDFARQAGVAELEADALGGLGDADYVRGRMISAHRHLGQSVQLARRDGFGRIEVANRSQMAHASLYFRPQRDALDDARAAADAARQVGHDRAELNARVAAMFACYACAELDELQAHGQAAGTLVSKLGAWRFEQSRLNFLAKAALAQGRPDEALALVRDALARGRNTGLGLEGPRTLGTLARALDAPGARCDALAEGEAIISQGCVGHNQPWFYWDAIDVALELRRWQEAERYAAALEAHTRLEPLPWCDFHIARARILASLRGTRPDQEQRRALEGLRTEASRLDFTVALASIEQALTS